MAPVDQHDPGDVASPDDGTGISRTVADILWLGYEDVSGLWEIVWDDAGTPEPGRTTQRATVFAGLLRRGLVEAVVGPLDGDDGAAPRLGPEVAGVLLTHPSAWRGPGDGNARAVSFWTTPAGFAAYRQATGWGQTSVGTAPPTDDDVARPGSAP